MQKNMGHHTYDLPIEVQRMYHQLMNSKSNFLKRLTHAENQSLTTSYERLIDTWNRNHIGALRSALEQTSLELRRMQTELASNFEEFRKGTREQLKADLLKRSKSLKVQSRSFDKSSKSLNDAVQTWKHDILQRETNLRMLRARFTRISKGQNEILQSAEKKLKSNQTRSGLLTKEYEQALMSLNALKTENLEKRQQKINDLSKRVANLKLRKVDFLNGLENRTETGEPNRTDLFARKKEASESLSVIRLKNQEALSTERSNLEQNLRNYEEELLRQLQIDLLKEDQNLPKELRQFFLTESTSLVSRKLNVIEKERKALSKILDRESLKRGIDRADLVKQFDASQSG